MGFFSALFSVGKKLFVPLVSIGKKAGSAIGQGIKSGIGKVKSLFGFGKTTSAPPASLTKNLIPVRSQGDITRAITEVMPVKQSWQAIRESGKAIGGVSKRGVGGLTKAQRLAVERGRITDIGKKANQAEFISDYLSL